MLKSGIYDFVICRGGTDMCFVLGFGRKRPDLKQYRISGLTELHMLGLRSWRSRLQQTTTQGQEPDLAHSKDSRSRRTSMPPHQDRSGYSCARTNTTVMAKCSVSAEGIDDPEEWRGASTKEFHPTNRDTQRRTRKSFDNPPPPGHPPHIKTTTTRSKPAISRTITKKEGIDDPKGAQGKSAGGSQKGSHVTQPYNRRPLDNTPSREHLPPTRKA